MDHGGFTRLRFSLSKGLVKQGLPFLWIVCCWLAVLGQVSSGGVAGTVVAWGSNDQSESTPPVGLVGVIAMAGCGEHCLVVKNDGTVVAWGFNDQGQTSVPATARTNAAGVAAGERHSVVLKRDGTVQAWGLNTSGQTNVPLGLSDVVAISAGGNHNLALKRDGSVVAWGSNLYGETTVPVEAQSGVRAIAAGFYHNVVLKEDGTVFVWGYGGNGEKNIPIGLSGVVAIAAGYHHVLAVKNDGTVVAWGYNTVGQTVVPSGLTGVTAVAAGFGHSAALKSDGTVAVWGFNNLGQLNIPSGLGGVAAIAAGGENTLALIGPVLTYPPYDQNFVLGGSLALSANSSGTGYTYQWHRNGTNIDGATNAILQLTNLTIGDVGIYQAFERSPSGALVISSTVNLLFFGDLKFYAGTTLAGLVGQKFRVEYADVLSLGTTNWQLLTNVVLATSPYVVIDKDSAGRTNRFYRALLDQ